MKDDSDHHEPKIEWAEAEMASDTWRLRSRFSSRGRSVFSLRGDPLKAVQQSLGRGFHAPGLRFDPEEVRYRYCEETSQEIQLRSLRALSGMTFGTCWDHEDPRLQIDLV